MSLFALILWILVSCDQPKNTIQFIGISDQDTVYRYQNTNCYFIANGISKLYENSIIDSVELFISTNQFGGEMPFDISSFDNDTFQFYLKGELLVEDSIREVLPEETDNFKFFGRLRYFDTEWHELTDTIPIDIINPLTFRKFEGKLEDGKRVGIWKEYYDDQKQHLARKSIFIDGLRNGNDSVFHDGKLRIFSQWENGKKHGEYYEFWGNGNIAYEANFVDGKLYGTWYIYSSSGELTDSLKSL